VIADNTRRLASIVERAFSGRSPNQGEALACLTAHPDRLKEAFFPFLATPTPLVLDCPVLFSNLCQLGQAPFPSRADDPRADVWSVDTLIAWVEKARAAGLTQGLMVAARFWDGLQVPGLESVNTLKTYGRVLALLRELVGDTVPITGFSPDEVRFLSVVSGRSDRYVLDYLAGHGLNTLLGRGAGLLTEPGRRALSPRLMPVPEWWRVYELAHRLGMAEGFSLSPGLSLPPVKQPDGSRLNPLPLNIISHVKTIRQWADAHGVQVPPVWLEGPKPQNPEGVIALCRLFGLSPSVLWDLPDDLRWGWEERPPVDRAAASLELGATGWGRLSQLVLAAWQRQQPLVWEPALLMASMGELVRSTPTTKAERP
jgi:hypothetical protein